MANNMIRYNPFNEVVSLRDAMDRLFEDSFISRNLSVWTVAYGPVAKKCGLRPKSWQACHLLDSLY